MFPLLYKLKPDYYLWAAWLMSIVATLGSLYYSEVLRLPPCNLCWYQRSMMYPLVFIILVAILEKDRKVYKYSFFPCVFGISTAFIQLILPTGLLPRSLEVCFNGISCSADYSGIFGFFSIPLQSLIGFSVIFYCLRVYYVITSSKKV